MSESPGQPESGRGSGGAFLSACDEGCHGSQVVRVGGVAEAQHDRDEGDDE